MSYEPENIYRNIFPTSIQDFSFSIPFFMHLNTSIFPVRNPSQLSGIRMNPLRKPPLIASIMGSLFVIELPHFWQWNDHRFIAAAGKLTNRKCNGDEINEQQIIQGVFDN